MRSIFILTATLLAAVVTPAMADPILSVIPQGLQGGNWVWEVDITPDLVQAGESTPIAEAIGFRLTGDPIVNVTNLSPLIMDTNVPANPIFGWETAYGSPAKPEGIEANCLSCTVTNLALLGGHASTVVAGSTNEIFTAMGSIDYGVSAPIPFLRITALGPAVGGPSTSTIQWLGAFAGKGQIVQLVAHNPQDFNVFAGTASQSVPEPSAVFLMATGIALLSSARRSAHRRARSF